MRCAKCNCSSQSVIRQNSWIMVACVVFIRFACLGDPSPGKDAAPAKAEVTEKTLDLMPGLTVYGKVLDQNGDAVPQAEIQIYWHTLRLGLGLRDDVKNEWITAGKDGSFRWTLIRGFQPAIQQLRKEGYEFIYKSGGDYFNSNSKKNLLSSTSKDKPLLLYLRKRGETTYLLKRSHHGVEMKLGGEMAALCEDILPEQHQDELDWRRKNKTAPVRKIGIRAKAEVLDGGAARKVTFQAPEGGGVLVRESLQYEAPAEGYQAEASATFLPKRYNGQMFWYNDPIWLFVKSAAPEIYARVKLDISFGEGDPLVYVDCDVNPYGERNFEEDPDLDLDARDPLEKEARMNLRTYKPVPKRDLTPLIKESKERNKKWKAR